MRAAIGIDVGGTKIAGGVVDTTTGRVLIRRQAATGAGRGGMAVLAEVASLAEALSAAATAQGLRPAATGVGLCELVSPEGRVFSGYRVDWRGLDIARRLGPVTLEADVRAAALAEARFGAGHGIRDLLYVTIGTGVSAVSVRDGVPYAGSRGAALVIANGPWTCTCPACGHAETRVLEDIASGPALAAATGLTDAETVLAHAADPAVARVLDHAAGALGTTVALLAGALDPAMVIIGGGLGSASGPYWDRLQAAIRAGLWEGDDHPLPLRQAALGADAGLIGAALTATLSQQEPVDRPQTLTA